MMGRKKTPQPKLFYDRINLDQRIRKDHILRKVDQIINFEFIYEVSGVSGVVSGVVVSGVAS